VRFRLSYTSISPHTETNDIRPTYCKSRHGGKPLELAANSIRIHLEYNVQVGYYWFHSDLKLTVYSSGLPTSFRYHLPLLFHTSKSGLHKHLSQVRVDPDWADRPVLHPMRHSLEHNYNGETSQSNPMLAIQPPWIRPRMLISKLSVRPEAARISINMQLDNCIAILQWMSVN